MNCPKCGAVIEESYKFCKNCGVAIPRKPKKTETSGCWNVLVVIIVIIIILLFIASKRSRQVKDEAREARKEQAQKKAQEESDRAKMIKDYKDEVIHNVSDIIEEKLNK